MDTKYKVKLKLIAEEHDLNVIYASDDYETYTISNYNVSRPALQLAGFYDYFYPGQIQIIGKAEMAYLRTLDEEAMEASLDRFFSHHVAAVIVCHRIPPHSLMVEYARKYNTNLLSTDVATSEFLAQIINTLRTHLAPRENVHGVLVQVHGEGLLITGDSGIGKSETALELVKRGHRLVADDAVEVKRMNRTTISGSAPEMIRYLMELRGLGLIDVRKIYGIGAVLPSCNIDLVVNFEHWDSSRFYDRLGLETETTSILGVEVPKVTIPVAPARNLAIILEVAAMNNRQKRLGHNTALEFTMQHDSMIDSGWNV
ncbi:MAG: HPr(Ser) kinase/phosphatase [Oscillospiraceae bacterium]|nr:HPr(Ser) kinase/phosphatase [Oscillospiraceae bacterium]